MKRFLAAVLFLGVGFQVSAQETAASSVDATVADETVAARVANGTRFGNWTLTCEALAVGETACVLNQRIARSSDGVFLSDFLMFWNPRAEDEIFLAARVAEGAYLPAGFAIRGESAADDAQRDLTWQSCSGDLCEALTAFTSDEIAALEDGGDVIAGYRPSLQSEAVIFRFSMVGAGAGLDALKAAAR